MGFRGFKAFIGFSGLGIRGLGIRGLGVLGVLGGLGV